MMRRLGSCVALMVMLVTTSIFAVHGGYLAAYHRPDMPLLAFVAGACWGAVFGLVLGTFCLLVRMPFPSMDESDPGKVPWRIFTVATLLLAAASSFVHASSLSTVVRF